MTIQEQLIKLNNTFVTLHKDFISLDNELKNADSKCSSKVDDVRRKWNEERDRINQKKEEVLKFYRIAKDNSSKELITSGIGAQVPDMGKLNSLIDRINVNNRNDPIAAQIIDLASSYIVFLDNELSKIRQKEEEEIKRVQSGKGSDVQNINSRKKNILIQCERYLRGEEVRNLVSLFGKIQLDYEIDNRYFEDWGKVKQRKRMMLLGYRQYPVDVPQKLSDTLKASLGKHFDKNTKMVNCPCGYTTDTHEDIYIEYTDFNESQMNSGIQALILNYLRYFRPNEYKISVFDYLYFNANVLGPLNFLGKMKNGILENIPSDSKELKNSIALLVQYYKKIENKIGNSSVYEFNRKCKPSERIPMRLLIINRQQEEFQQKLEPEMAYLINNAEKFGITTIRMTKSTDGGSKGKDREKKYLAKASDYIRIISDSTGGFYIEDDVQWLRFSWIQSVNSVPSGFVDKIENAVKPNEIGTKYFKRYQPKLPTRSNGKRRAIEVPFAVDDEDKVVTCNFENELFAAFMMGASRSGKSTLLHTIICGLMMNYHPDELELWLLDFKMLEFKKYADHKAPHIKYLLLEKSEDLVFDIIDKMTAMLDERQYIFAQHGWNKLTEVPADVYMPAIFVIIDEFSDMSQILKETKGLGYTADYTIKLENLLKRGAALGFKFIFASQTYTTGVSGLTEMACKQIQLRFALKNTPDEIKQTLVISSDQLTPDLSAAVADMPPYETLFKWRNPDGLARIGKFRNMYSESDEQNNLIDMIQTRMHIQKNGEKDSDLSYRFKDPVYIEGNEPKTFASQIVYYKRFESQMDIDDMDESDVLIYAGVPCSFNLSRPFTLVNGISENILIAGGDRENKLSVLLSIFHSYRRKNAPIEIWSHDRNSMYKKYKNSIFEKKSVITDLDDICDHVSKLRRDIEDRKVKNKLICVLGYENIANDLEILGADGERKDRKDKKEKPAAPKNGLDLNEVMLKIKQTSDPEEKKRLLEEYNKQASQTIVDNTVDNDEDENRGIYDARDDIKWIIKRAPNYGVHFVFCFDQPKDFLNTKIDEASFQHKLLFAMAKDESINIMGNRKANEIDDGVCIYSDGKDTYTMRPHIYKGIPLNGWRIEDDGKIVQRR